ncbi:nucleoside triphosphate pyrophosphohydrolase [Pseudomarimonas salicorniae]|uniref:Nucleoside triphosphate pyrophosphohydrolase n=1 Tax=Pseudomarimonas salicorniae TaxID=2933270 RepID=A0ABT0GE07_9GAMM|nr:nucleoside triphosphate pyrophosphohydrolase [Lysobacter sp. CAU 1642]MCK7592788.1 nucleoside triphosphate pyrophosphohydrolase [Lysobacter sp. CAU 1642]
MSDAADQLERLITIMAALRDPEGGCPWDLEQDFASIAPYTIEEAYEVADAIERGDMGDLREELGDLLLQVVFHAQMARERDAFDLADVARAISDKMVARHPHVFGDVEMRDSAEQTEAWEQGKAAERAAKGETDDSALAGIARGLPEWMRAIKLQKRAARVGFDWPSPDPVFDKLHEEIDELRAEFRAEDPGRLERLEDELGDVLFVAANLARHAGVDPGRALRRANAKFERRFRRMETLARERGIELAAQPLAEQDKLWDEAKREERKG